MKSSSTGYPLRYNLMGGPFEMSLNKGFEKISKIVLHEESEQFGLRSDVNLVLFFRQFMKGITSYTFTKSASESTSETVKIEFMDKAFPITAEDVLHTAQTVCNKIRVPDAEGAKDTADAIKVLLSTNEVCGSSFIVAESLREAIKSMKPSSNRTQLERIINRIYGRKAYYNVCTNTMHNADSYTSDADVFGLQGETLPWENGTRIRVGRVLGRGGFGVVYEADWYISDRKIRKMALKLSVIALPDNGLSIPSNRTNEGISILHSHEFFLKRDYTTQLSAHISMELQPRFDFTLKTLLEQFGFIREDMACLIGLQLLKQLKEINTERPLKNILIHCDIKLQNIMVSLDPNVRGFMRVDLIDWGIAQPFKSANRHAYRVVTPYSPPSYIPFMDVLQVRADLWAIGYVMWSLVSPLPWKEAWLSDAGDAEIEMLKSTSMPPRFLAPYFDILSRDTTSDYMTIINILIDMLQVRVNKVESAEALRAALVKMKEQ